MSSEITITNVPDELRATLERRAKMYGQTVEEFILADLKRFAPTGSNDVLLREAREWAESHGARLTAEQILEARDEGRESL